MGVRWEENNNPKKQKNYNRLAWKNPGKKKEHKLHLKRQRSCLGLLENNLHDSSEDSNKKLRDTRVKSIQKNNIMRQNKENSSETMIKQRKRFKKAKKYPSPMWAQLSHPRRVWIIINNEVTEASGILSRGEAPSEPGERCSSIGIKTSF